MAAQPKLTPEQWLACRQRWETDPREGFAWLVEDMGLPISAPAVRKAAGREGWSKLAEAPAKVAGKVSPMVSQRNHEGSETMSETITETLPATPPEAEPQASKPPKTPQEKRPVGRQSLYRPEFAELAYNYCLLGATDAQLAVFFGVCERTINEWKDAHPEFLQSLKEGKVMADAQIAASLYRLGTGYSHPETKVFVHQGRVIEHAVTRHYPPDTTACIFWLKNRQPDKWRDRQEVAVESTADTPEDRAARDLAIERAFQRAMEEKERMLERAASMKGNTPGSSGLH